MFSSAQAFLYSEPPPHYLKCKCLMSYKGKSLSNALMINIT